MTMQTFCSGTIISEFLVVTSAHCFTDAQGNAFSNNYLTFVEVGQTRPGSGPGNSGCNDVVRVRRRILHPKARIRESDKGFLTAISDDIAWLELDRKLDFSKPCICKACIHSTQAPRFNEDCIVSGFGCKDFQCMSPPFTPLASVRTKLGVKQDQCDYFSPQDDAPGTSTCTIPIRAGEATCSADSGGGLFCYDRRRNSHFLHAITKFGIQIDPTSSDCQTPPIRAYLDENGRISIEPVEEPFPDGTFLTPAGMEPLDKHLRRTQLYAPEIALDFVN